MKNMKRILSLVIVTIMVLLLVSCNQSNNNNQSNIYQAPITSAFIAEEDYECDIDLTDDDAKKILSLLNEGEWISEERKETGRYIFRLKGDKEIYYITAGIFYDKERDLYLHLAEDDRVYINRILLSQCIPPVEYIGPMVQKKDITVSEAIDDFSEVLNEADCGGSVIIDILFGGDVELAKKVMENEIYNELFPDREITSITIERFWDEIEMRPCDDSERFEVYYTGRNFTIRTKSAIYIDKYTKIETENGEYYKTNSVKGSAVIDLGRGVIMYVKVIGNQPDGDEIFEKLIEYGLSIRNSVIDWEASPLI